VELFEAQEDLDIGAFAHAARVPAGTLEDWLQKGCLKAEESSADSGEDAQESDETRSLHIQSILSAYETWHGNFVTFCKHVREHLRLPYGDSFIGRILHTYGVRTPRRRKGRSPDEEALKSAFEVFFPGAQWVGDGKQVKVTVNGVVFTFNFELFVDAYSDALVGASVRDEEDSLAVIEAFRDGVETTQETPIATLLDNRPANHTEVVDAALGDTVRIRSTEGRAQNKAHAEGAFGLFSQTAPPIVIDADTPRELARQILRLQIQTLGRVLNHRPRRDRSWRSRIELYNGASPSDAEIAKARQKLEERRQRQEKARQTRLARTDSFVRQRLNEAFERLGLADPEEHFRSAIATYGRDAVLDSIAIFEGKKTAGTLPDNVDARYLLGIVRNVAHVHEADVITQALLAERLAASDFLLTALETERCSILKTVFQPEALLHQLIDRALDAQRRMDRLFWVDAAAATLCGQPSDTQPHLFRQLARRIHATFALPAHERQRIERLLARSVWNVT